MSIFSFDDHAIPFKSNLKLTLDRLRRSTRAIPCVPRGPAGSVDAFRAQFYGSVIRIGGKYRMWYMAGADDAAVNKVDTSFRLAYAESEDGHSLGEAAARADRVRRQQTQQPGRRSLRISICRAWVSLVCFVLHEPEDKDPAAPLQDADLRPLLRVDQPGDSRAPEQYADHRVSRFSAPTDCAGSLAIPPPKGPWFVESEVPFPVKNNFELGGLYKFDGIYYAAGQEMWPDISLPDGSRVRRTMVTHWSGDFIHWSHDRSFSFQRYGYRSPDMSLEEAHEPAGVWNRGNVLVGMYGLWHGARGDQGPPHGSGPARERRRRSLPRADSGLPLPEGRRRRRMGSAGPGSRPGLRQRRRPDIHLLRRLGPVAQQRRRSAPSASP